MNSFVLALSGLVPMADKVPSEEEIGTGWMYFVLFVLLVLAIAFLGWSLTRHLRKVRHNAETGVFGADDAPR